MRFLRNNGLTLVLLALTIFTIGGMLLAGWSVHNEELTQHGAAELSLSGYVASGHFLSAIFENWESEFLQMSAYVMLTAFLFQRGSAESKNPDKPDIEAEYLKRAENDEDARPSRGAGKTGSGIYAYSLGIALFSLFIVSFILHLRYSSEAANQEAVMHGEVAKSIGRHLTSAQFWFESMQNWQSEFLSTAVIVVLSIFLRFRGSPESKPVSAPNSDTGS
jgi:hypothetical protein